MIIDEAKTLFSKLDLLDTVKKIDTINELKKLLHNHSPFKSEPVDCVLWVTAEKVQANDYNPNVVAPPEMKLLELSVINDGYTQPIVSWSVDGIYEVVDGFHRHRVGSECNAVKERIGGYLPIVAINASQEGRSDRIASTIRHNRARGKHTVQGMSDIVLELKNRNWKNKRIARELGMEEDEILRLCQITGLAELFADEEFSKSWEVDGCEDDFIPLSDEIKTYGPEVGEFRTVNTNDENRVFYTHDKWECFKAGFYATTKDGMTKDQCEAAYAEFLADTERFKLALEHVISEWTHSCEHYLTNASMNRIAWLGQAAMCYDTGVPAVFRSGFSLLSEEQQNKANETALIYLNKWLDSYNAEKLTLEEGLSGKQMNLY